MIKAFLSGLALAGSLFDQAATAQTADRGLAPPVSDLLAKLRE